MRWLAAAAAIMPTGALAAAPPPATITCHLMIGGQPSPNITTYRWQVDGLYADGRRISSTRLIPLGTVIERDGRRTQTFARHAWRGGQLHRTVYARTGVGPMRVTMRERYDFARQRVFDLTTGGGDVCHHRG